MTAITIKSDAHWKELRLKHIGCSEIAALFNEHPQISQFELWHQKKGNIPVPDLDDVERVQAGQFLEPAIAAWIADKTGWKIQKVHRYLSHDSVPGFGGTLDYEIISHKRGPGVLEIKNVDGLIARRWEDGEPGLHQMLQVQGQLTLTGRAWGALGVLVGGNDLRIFEFDRRPATIARLEKEVAAFWQSIADDKPPKPDMVKDADTISALYQTSDSGKVLDLTGDNRLPELCAEYLKAAADAKAADERKSAAKSEMLIKIGDAGRVFCGAYTINAKTIAGTSIAYERKPYRDFRMSEKVK